MTRQKPGTLSRAQQQYGYITKANTIGDYIRNNNRACIFQHCHTEQLQNSFFVKTETNWNHLDYVTVHTTSVQNLKALAAATQHQ